MNKMGMRSIGPPFKAYQVQLLDVVTGTESDNLFQITGTVLVEKIHAFVTTAVNAVDCDTVYLDLFPAGGAAILITAAAGLDIVGAPVGSEIWKNDDATGTLALTDSTLGAVEEVVVAGVGIDPFSPFKVTQKTGGIATYIRCTYTSTQNPCTGALLWEVEWSPCSNDASLVAV